MVNDAKKMSHIGILSLLIYETTHVDTLRAVSLSAQR